MYDDLTRPPLSAAALTRALAPQGWRVEVLGSVDSTNETVAVRAAAGEPGGLVLVAEQQTSGRGRLDRSWQSPPRAGLTFSVLLRPVLPRRALPVSRWGLVPLLAGTAVATAVRQQTGLPAELKWPNDVLVDGRKLCGLLAQVVDDAIVLGIGLNVSTRADELPHEQATSLLLEGAVMDRDTVLRAVLRSLSDVLTGPDAVDLSGYRELCCSLGRAVRVELPGGGVREGVAEAVDEHGRLVVDGVAYAAGDVVHLR